MLTDTAVKAAKPRETPYKLADSGWLYLHVAPSGGRSWRMDYRHQGKRYTVTIGKYPQVSLSAARKSRDEMRSLLANGIDPRANKQAVKQDAANTFSSVAAAYLEKLRGDNRADNTIAKNEWLLSFAFPRLGSRAIRDINAAAILDVLHSVEARGRYHTTARLRAIIGAVFRFAIADSKAEADPTQGLSDALIKATPKPRAAVTEKKAFAGLLRSVWGYDGCPEAMVCLRLLVLLAPRPGELRLAEWTEFDLETNIWTVPAGRMKMRKPHRAPLSSQAVTLLKEHREIVRPGTLVFPSTRSAARPISENTTNAALRRLGYTSSQASSHGFRASFSTLANESGLWNADAIERALAHTESNDVRRAYARGEHWEERVRMMQWWANLCDELRASK